MAVIVIHSMTKERISKTVCYEWSLHEAHRNRHGELFMRSQLIKREKAMELIKKHGLVEAYREREGQIYDTPDGAFKSLFPNGVSTNAEKEAIKRANL